MKASKSLRSTSLRRLGSLRASNSLTASTYSCRRVAMATLILTCWTLGKSQCKQWRARPSIRSTLVRVSRKLIMSLSWWPTRTVKRSDFRLILNSWKLWRCLPRLEKDGAWHTTIKVNWLLVMALTSCFMSTLRLSRSPNRLAWLTTERRSKE